MEQWVAEIAYHTPKGPKEVVETYYLPTVDDVRNAVAKKGGFCLAVRPHQRSTLERLLARSTWWQVQLLRGIQFRAQATSPGVALWRIIRGNQPTPAEYPRSRAGGSLPRPWRDRCA